SASVQQVPAQPLTQRAWRQIVDRLLPLNIRLRITGGEPTLHPEFEDVLAYIDARGMSFTLFTNGRWTDPQRTVDFLRSLRYLECLLISVHGAGPPSHEAFTATPGSLEETLANVRLATDAGLRVTSSTVITHQNHNELPELFALARSVGIRRHTLSRYFGPPLPGIEASEAELACAVRSVEKMRNNGYGPRDGVDTVHYGGPIPRCFTNNSSNGCMAGFAHAAIDCWGNLKPCTHVSVTAGSLLEADFDTLWHSPAMEAWRAAYLAQCDGCPLAGECRSGCLAQAIWRGQVKDPLIKLTL
ncbi:MAG TPA: radical SAM protein, partial [Anaerolineae bacterium]|nr:radical SAM protein [Anaerolineae bacterium]